MCTMKVHIFPAVPPRARVPHDPAIPPSLPPATGHLIPQHVVFVGIRETRLRELRAVATRTRETVILAQDFLIF